LNPNVFVTHASDDKERFVLGFATKLREKGIDAWLDKWEMLPGDSLVDKIFEEGIKNAKAIIAVISINSISKPWVKEELNAAMIKKINGVSKIIPVIIDDCEVPECLHSTLWEKIKDLNNYETELDRIVMSIYGHSFKPPLGSPPQYTQTIIDILPGLTHTDSLIFKIACEHAMVLGYLYINTGDIFPKAESFNINMDAFEETIEVLDSKGYIKAERTMGGIFSFTIMPLGFDDFARLYIEDYDSIVKSVALRIVNFNEFNNIIITESLNIPRMLTDHILEMMTMKGYIKTTKSFGGGIIYSIYDISPELKRALRSI
jgi:hypothetical protein